MTAASYQFGSMNDTTLPGGIRVIRLCAKAIARACNVWQSTRMSPSTRTVRSGVRCAASRRASASVVRTHNPRRYASAARFSSTLTRLNLAFDSAHGHGVAIPRRGMRIYRDLGDLTVRRCVRALHFECGTARFDLEQGGQLTGRGDRRDLLVHLDDAYPEKVLDEREDRTGVPLQQPAHRGEGTVDVILRLANRCPGAVGLPVAAHRQPLGPDVQAGPGGEVVVDCHHRVRFDRERCARCEGEQVID